MKNDAIMTLTLAALLSAQSLIEDPNVADADKIAARAQQENLLQGLLEYAQKSQPRSEIPKKEQFSEWARSLYINFFDHIPNMLEFFEWLQDNPPPRGVPTRSIDIFLCDFFQDTRAMKLQ